MGGAPSDRQFITGGVPDEMKQGVELTEGVEVAAPTAAMGADGVTEQITRVRIPRPAHIPAGPPKVIEVDDDRPVRLPRSTPSLRYEFPLFPDIQCVVEFQGNATADHLEQLVSLLDVQCGKLRQQEARRRTLELQERLATPARKTSPRKVKTNDATTKRRGTQDPEAPAEGEE